MISRRNILSALPLAGAAVGLAGCGIVSSNTTGGVTTLTINVGKLNTLMTVAEADALALLQNPLIATAIGPAVDKSAILVVDSIKASMKALSASVPTGTQTLSFNANNVPAALTSLQNDITALFADVTTGVNGAGKSLGANVINGYDAFQTLLALALALIPFSAKSVALEAMPVKPKKVMSEEKALAVKIPAK